MAGPLDPTLARRRGLPAGATPWPTLALCLGALVLQAGATALAAPFAAFKRIHLHHHAHTSDPAEDPDFWVVGKRWPGALARFATTWRGRPA